MIERKTKRELINQCLTLTQRMSKWGLLGRQDFQAQRNLKAHNFHFAATKCKRQTC